MIPIQPSPSASPQQRQILRSPFPFPHLKPCPILPPSLRTPNMSTFSEHSKPKPNLHPSASEYVNYLLNSKDRARIQVLKESAYCGSAALNWSGKTSLGIMDLTTSLRACILRIYMQTWVSNHVMHKKAGTYARSILSCDSRSVGDNLNFSLPLFPLTDFLPTGMNGKGRDVGNHSTLTSSKLKALDDETRRSDDRICSIHVVF